MKETYSHKAVQSFALWFEHFLLNKGQAYQNYSGSLYPTDDDRIDQDTYRTWSSPFKQWVYDSSVSGATICNGVYDQSGQRGRNEGIIFDYNNGRIVVTSGDSGTEFSAAYSIKDINTYVVDTEETKMIFDEAFHINSRYGMIPESGVSPYGYAAPACFIMNPLTENKPWAFGGEQNTTNKFRAIVVSDDKFALDGCVSLFRDLGETIIPIVSLKDDPLNEYGDLKSGSYSYAQLAEDNKDDYMFLEKVTASKITSTQQTKLNPNLKYAIIDFYLSHPRVPK